MAGFSAVVPRARTIQVKYLDEHGEHQSVEATGGTPGFCNMRLTICRARYTSIGCTAARSLRSTTGIVSGKRNRYGLSCKTCPGFDIS
jgi:hypothetical protein